MIVVGDASPLIALAAVGHLDLLRHLYAEVLVPDAVQREMLARPDAPGAGELLVAGWVHVHPVADATLVHALSSELDPGEAEAVALAVEVAADLLLMDERRGRAVAVRLGLGVVGVLGVLTEAKQRGLLPEVRPVLDRLDTEAGFYIGESLCRRILDQVGEG